MKVIAEAEKGDKTYKQAQKEYDIQGNSIVLRWVRKHRDMKNNSSPQEQIKAVKKEIEKLRKEKEVLQIVIDIAEEES